MSEFNLEQFLANIPEGKGGMNKNQQKKLDTHPDYRGYARIQGQIYEIGGWVKDNNGKKRLSMSFKPYQVAPPAPKPEMPKAKYANDNIADDLPF